MTDKDTLIAERPGAIAYYNHRGPGGTLYWAENLTPDRAKGFKPLYSAEEIVLAKREALTEATEIVREIGREFPQRMPLCMEIVNQIVDLIGTEPGPLSKPDAQYYAPLGWRIVHDD